MHMNMRSCLYRIYCKINIHIHDMIFFSIIGIVYLYRSICRVVSSIVQDGFSPLYAASECGHSQIVDILLLKGADPNLNTKVRIIWTGVAITLDNVLIII